MPTRKQRRRREKGFRHEYGFVTYDEEGNEVEVESSELKPEKPKADKPTPDKSKAKAKTSGRGSRATREPPAPSWRRSFRRGGTWGGVMLIVVILFFKSQSLGSRIAIGVLYALAFVPLTYWIDRLAYRNWQRRTTKK